MSVEEVVVLKRKRTDVPPSVFRETTRVGAKPRLIARQVLPTTMITTPLRLALTIRVQSERVCFV
jgi:hypothetical protein